jgi:hypothetical protein
MRASLLACPVLFVALSCVAATAQESTDSEVVYRLQPSVEGATLRRVPSDEIKPGLAYNYYHAGLNRRVWGLAKEGGGFEFAFGESTTLPTTRFDLRLDEESQEEILDVRIPGLKDALKRVGRAPSVRLGAEGNWELLPFAISERVFDLLSSRRWEWHGKHRVAVMHTGGYLWDYVGGKFLPLNIVAMPCY